MFYSMYPNSIVLLLNHSLPLLKSNTEKHKTLHNFTLINKSPTDSNSVRVLIFIYLYFQNKPLLVEPIDFEGFIVKNRTVIQNDPHRELLLYPANDVQVSCDCRRNGKEDRQSLSVAFQTERDREGELTRFIISLRHRRKSSNQKPFARQLRTFQPCQRT